MHIRQLLWKMLSGTLTGLRLRASDKEIIKLEKFVITGGKPLHGEVMRLNPAIRNMIRDNKVHQIDGVIASSAHEHMRSMDQSLLELYKQNKITKETALKFASNADMLKRKL